MSNKNIRLQHFNRHLIDIDKNRQIVICKKTRTINSHDNLQIKFADKNKLQDVRSEFLNLSDLIFITRCSHEEFKVANTQENSFDKFQGHKQRVKVQLIVTSSSVNSSKISQILIPIFYLYAKNENLHSGGFIEISKLVELTSISISTDL